VLRIRLRDPVLFWPLDPGSGLETLRSGIWDKHTGSATLLGGRERSILIMVSSRIIFIKAYFHFFGCTISVADPDLDPGCRIRKINLLVCRRRRQAETFPWHPRQGPAAQCLPTPKIKQYRYIIQVFWIWIRYLFGCQLLVKTLQLNPSGKSIYRSFSEGEQ
jgi:hypothetical protein